jgi:hypothetical protein
VLVERVRATAGPAASWVGGEGGEYADEIGGQPVAIHLIVIIIAGFMHSLDHWILPALDGDCGPPSLPNHWSAECGPAMGLLSEHAINK